MCASRLATREVFLGVRLKGRGRERARGQKRSQQGEGLLLEGSTDGATLEWLGWAVVVHHAVLSRPIGGEEQGAEFGHL